MESILMSIKKPLGVDATYTHFDQDIIMFINSSFLSLRQIGIGPENGFSIEDSNSKWVDFVQDPFMQTTVKTYIYLKVRLAFDPPSTSFVIAAIERQIDELTWRLNVQASIDRMEEG